MDDFLYIIVLILWVAYSLYNSKQKKLKKQAMEEQRKRGMVPPVTTPAPPKRSLLEELLGQEIKLPEPAAEVEEYAEPEYESVFESWKAENINPETESYETYEEEVPVSYFEQEYARRANVDVFAPEYDRPVLLKEEDLKINEREQEEFDLRRAVIYSEILNPRYI